MVFKTDYKLENFIMGTETKRTKSRNFNTESPNLIRETLANVIN